jgi:MFS family permease
VSQPGDWLYNVALAVWVYDRTGSAAWIAAITFVRLLPYVLLAPIGGVVADRYERRTVLLVTDVARGSLMACLAVVVALDGSVLVATALAFLVTACGTAYFPSIFAFVPELVPEDDLAAANSVTSVIENGSVVVGPAVAGTILAFSSPAWAFAINAGTFAWAALVYTTIHSRSRAPVHADEDERPRGMRHELLEGGRAVGHSPTARALLSLVMATSFVYGVLTVVLVILASERLGLESSDVGFLYAALGVGGVVAAPLTARLGRSARLTVVTFGFLLVTSLPLVLLAPVRHGTVAFLLVVLVGLGSVVVDVLSITMLQRTLDDRVKGRVFGILDSLVVAAILTGSVLVSPLRAWLGFGPMLLVLGVVGPALVLLQTRPLLEADRDAAFTYARLEPVVDDLRRTTLFGLLSRAALERLAASTEKERFARGETILREGDEADRCYVVLHGAVDVRSTRSGGAVVATLREHDYFGEIGLLQGVPRTATVEAASDCVLYSIDADAFRGAVNADCALSAVAFEGAATRLAHLER